VTRIDGDAGAEGSRAATRVDPDIRPIVGAVEGSRAWLRDAHAVRRLWERDHTLWQDDPTEVTDRLGWLDLPEDARGRLAELEDVARGAADAGCTHALVLGMGGSSLFPLVLAETFAGSRLELRVLDSVDPAAIRAAERSLPLDRTFVVASSKSGTTVETRTLLAHTWEVIGDGGRFAVVTDPGTPLEELAEELGFAAAVQAPSDVGGRYSALTPFGLLPAALLGVDLGALLDRAAGMADACRSQDPRENPGAELAAIIGGAARSGRDKLTLVLPDRISTFGAWVEQLVAESTGKEGVGVLPVVGEPVGPPEAYGTDRLFVAYGDVPGLDELAGAGHPVVRIPLDGDPLALGAEVVRWEVTTALLGALLGINPFDQPDVEAAKRAAKELLAGGVPEGERGRFGDLVTTLRPGDYLAILAYVPPDAPVVDELERVRAGLRDRYRVAVTLGVGPRYLHSTGQLHKGGPDTGVFAMVIGEDEEDLPIPGEDHGFATLKRAQAAGDLHALREAGRRAELVELDDLSSRR
jgi:glucose-6-phosphate isomerase